MTGRHLILDIPERPMSAHGDRAGFAGYERRSPSLTTHLRHWLLGNVTRLGADDPTRSFSVGTRLDECFPQ
jgi:hypothetical protein